MSAKLTTKGWIARARAVHGPRYDYSLVVYRASTAVVVIGCAVHGCFAQAGNYHLQGYGCPACRAVATPIKLGHKGPHRRPSHKPMPSRPEA